MEGGSDDNASVRLAVVFDGREYAVGTTLVEKGDDENTALVSLELLQCQLMSLAGLAPDEQVLLSSVGKVLSRPGAALAPVIPVSTACRTRLFLLPSSALSAVPPDWREICTKCSFGDAPVVQSAFRKLNDASVLVCGPCARTCSTAFQPVHPHEWSELPAVKTRFISDIVLVAGEVDVPAPSGFAKLPWDINFGADGDYVYLCVRRGGSRAVTQLHAEPEYRLDGDSTLLPQAEHVVSADRGNGLIHMGFDCVQLADSSTKVDTLAITDISIIYGDEQTPNKGFIKIPVNLNVATTAAAKPVYLCYQVAPIGGFTCDSGRGHSEFGECLFASRFPSDPASSSIGHGLPERLVLSSERTAMDVAVVEAHYLRHQPAMRKRLEGGVQRARSYESKAMQEEALKHIPVKLLEERAQANPSPMPLYQDELVQQLLHWFKREFFTWMNQPRCSSCNHEKTRSVRTEGPKTPEEIAGQAGRVEVYQCPSCSALTRFPRYNDPVKLLTTRTGRCGEWANCFTLCCRAMGFEARYVLDVTDHVWTEVYSEHFKRWLHCDSCEDQLDCPLTYEVGWGKKLSYIFSFSSEEVVDTARRYTQNWEAMRARRRDAGEVWLEAMILEMNQRLREGLPAERVDTLRARAIVEEEELRVGRSVKKGEVQGRVSGSNEWKSGRQEDGKSGVNVASSTGVHNSTDKSGAGAEPSKAELLQQIFRNLVIGCGNSACVNPFCAHSLSTSAKIKAADPTERAASAIQVISELNEQSIPAGGLGLLLCPRTAEEIRAFMLGRVPTAYYPLQDPPRSLAGDCIVDVSGFDHHISDSESPSSLGTLRKPFRIPHSGVDNERAFGMQLLADQQLGVPSGVSTSGVVASFLFRIDKLALPQGDDSSGKTHHECLGILVRPTASDSAPIRFQVTDDPARGRFTWTLNYKTGDSIQTLSGAASVEFNRYGNLTLAVSEHEFAVFIDGIEAARAGAEETSWLHGDAATHALIIKNPAAISREAYSSIGLIVSHLVLFPLVSIDDTAALAMEMARRFVSAPPLKAFGPNGVQAGKRCTEDVAAARSGYRVSRVQMWGGQFLDGIQFVYALATPSGTGDAEVHGLFIGNAAAKKAAKTPTIVLELWEDEYIVDVSGRKGAWTDGLKLRTNFGREVRCGGSGGGDFSIRSPPDSEVRAITFNAGDHLTNPVAFVVDGAPTVPPLKSSAVTERLRAVLAHTEAGSSRLAISAMLRYLSNISSQPTDHKFQRIRANNNYFVANVAALGEEAAGALMRWSGFVEEERDEGAGDKFYVFQPEQKPRGRDAEALAAQAQRRIACLDLLLGEISGAKQ